MILIYLLTLKLAKFVLSDHDSVYLSLDLHDVYTSGPGIWRLNLDLLNDENFCSQISELISAHLEFIKAMNSRMVGFFERIDQRNCVIFGPGKISPT